MAWPEVFGKETDNVQRLKVLLRMSQCLFTKAELIEL